MTTEEFTQYRVEFRVLDPGRKPKTKWLLYPSGRNVMDRFVLAEDDFCLVDSADTIDRMLQQKGTDTFVRDATQIFVMNDVRVIAKTLRTRVEELPLRMSPSVEIRLVEHKLKEEEQELVKSLEAQIERLKEQKKQQEIKNGEERT